MFIYRLGYCSLITNCINYHFCINTMSTNQTVTTEPDELPDQNDESARSVDADESLDLTFDVLRNRRRRLVLRHLKTTPESASLGDLAEHIAAIENGIDRSQIDSQQRKRVYISLYQNHLPKLDDAEVVRFDQDRGTVSLTETADPFYEYLDDSPEQTASDGSEPSARYRLAAALVTAVTYGVATSAGATVVASLAVLLFLSWFVLQTLRE